HGLPHTAARASLAAAGPCVSRTPAFALAAGGSGVSRTPASALAATGVARAVSRVTAGVAATALLGTAAVNDAITASTASARDIPKIRIGTPRCQAGLLRQ